MDSSEIERELEELESRCERLRALYEQYFMGLEKLEPSVPRKDVDRRIWILRRVQIRNTGLRFKFQMLVQRYNTFQQYWTRVSREMENGTYKRDVMRAVKRMGEQDALTILGKKRAAQFAAIAETQAGRERDRRQSYDILEEIPDDPAPPSVPVGRPSHVALSAGADAAAPPSVVKPAASPDRSRVATLLREMKSGRSSTLPSLGGPLDLDLGEPGLVAPSAPAPKLAPRRPAPPRAAPPLPAAARPSAPLPPAAAARVSAPTPPPVPGPRPPPPRPPLPSSAAGRPPAAAASPSPRPPVAPPAGAAPARPAPRATGEDALPEQRIHQIYAKYVETKRASNESTAGVTMERLAESLRAQTEKLRAQNPTRTVDYDVVVKDGKTILKPVLR